jgi:CHRD domain
MRTKLISSCGLVTLSLLVTACGGGGTSSTGSKSPAAAAAARPSREFVLTMTGRAESPPGAPQGVGKAVIAFHDNTHQICWRFAHLHGFSTATYAHIHKGASHKSGPIVLPLSTGPALHHRGCVAAGPALMAAIAKNPEGYYVNIHSAKYPAGAVRAQL